jgi:hypothetical protein
MSFEIKFIPEAAEDYISLGGIGKRDKMEIYKIIGQRILKRK